MKLIARLVLLLGIAALAVWPLYADIVILKDGFILQGIVKRESVTEFDPVSKEPIDIPKGFFMVDDGARRIYFSPSMVRTLEKKDLPQEEKWVHPKSIYIAGGKNPPPFHHELESTPWDAKWERTFRYQSPAGVVGLYQHMSFLSSYAARVDATNKFFWSCMYLTQELGPEICLKLLEDHADFKNTKNVKPEELVSRKFRIVDFLAQAGWFSDAENEIKKILIDHPDQEDRGKKALEALAGLRGRERLEKIKRIQAAGRIKEAKKLLDSFPTAEASGNTLTGLQTLQSRLEKINESLEKTRKQLYLTAQAHRDQKLAPFFPDALDAISLELNEANVERLETFFSQAVQAEAAGPEAIKKKCEALASLAVTGWLLGNTAANSDPGQAKTLWNTRQFIWQYLKEETLAARLDALKTFTTGEKSRVDEVAAILGNMSYLSLAPATAAKGNSPFERKIPSGRNKDLTYWVRLPPEYSPNRTYPLLFLFPKKGEKVVEQMAQWSTAADENGTILAGFRWGGGGNYAFSEKEHHEILDIVRDLKFYFPVDPDRVFLFGLEQGAQIAYDIGLSHPDLFAGVVPMSGLPDFYIDKYWRNGQYLPFFVVCGDRSGDPNSKTRALFNNWMPRSFPSIWVQYKGRGLEWFKAETPAIFDWMRFKTRNFPMSQLGTDGGGTVLGNEFQSTRYCDTKYYWIGSNSIQENRINYPTNWKANLSPASFFCKTDRGNNTINVRVHGVKDFFLLLGRNAKGETQINFEKPVTVATSFTNKWVGKAVPSLETLMENLYETADRTALVYTRLTIKP
ncbi:MAG: hypothetical protein EXR99_00230 [Gemmataceae bacterium]|nr:hypothetical protein [Gemmataceae bacterium]